jgi:hypothetical protein
MQYWLARFSWSFLILAAVSAWDAYSSLRGYGRYLPEWRIYLQLLLAAAFIVLGFMGVRARHRETTDERR